MNGNGIGRRLCGAELLSAVSPHPGPLPRGEGTTLASFFAGDGHGLNAASREINRLEVENGAGEGSAGMRVLCYLIITSFYFPFGAS